MPRAPTAHRALAFAAGQINRIKLGTMVTGVTYRHPGILVKSVASPPGMLPGELQQKEIESWSAS